MTREEINGLDESGLENLITKTLDKNEKDIISFVMFILDECYDIDYDNESGDIVSKHKDNCYVLIHDKRFVKYLLKSYDITKNDI